jgi:hypothetical protein
MHRVTDSIGWKNVTWASFLACPVTLLSTVYDVEVSKWT